MRAKDLEEVLGDFYKLLVHPAYSEDYLYVARHNNAKVSKKRIETIRKTINQRIKELQEIDKQLRDHNT